MYYILRKRFIYLSSKFVKETSIKKVICCELFINNKVHYVVKKLLSEKRKVLYLNIQRRNGWKLGIACLFCYITLIYFKYQVGLFFFFLMLLVVLISIILMAFRMRASFKQLLFCITRCFSYIIFIFIAGVFYGGTSDFFFQTIYHNKNNIFYLH